MINLLPTEDIRENLADYRRRRLVVAGWIFLALILASALSLASLFFILHTKLVAAKANLAVGERQAAAAEFDRLEKVVREAETKIQVLAIAGKKLPPTLPTLIEQAISHRLAAIKITDITGEDNGEEMEIRLRGRAATRQSLLAFVASLEADETFSSVESPISNLIKDRDAEFNIILRTHHES